MPTGNAGLLDDAVAVLPALVQRRLARVGSQVTAAEDLSAQPGDSPQVIAEGRALRRKAEERPRPGGGLRPGAALEAKPEHDEMLRERREKVRQLRPVPEADDE